MATTNNNTITFFSDNTRPISLDAKASDIFTGDGFGDEQDDENILSREDFDSMF